MYKIHIHFYFQISLFNLGQWARAGWARRRGHPPSQCPHMIIRRRRRRRRRRHRRRRPRRRLRRHHHPWHCLMNYHYH